MEVLRWRRSDESKLALVTVAVELLGAAGARQLRLRVLRTTKEERGN